MFYILNFYFVKLPRTRHHQCELCSIMMLSQDIFFSYPVLLLIIWIIFNPTNHSIIIRNESFLHISFLLVSYGFFQYITVTNITETSIIQKEVYYTSITVQFNNYKHLRPKQESNLHGFSAADMSLSPYTAFVCVWNGNGFYGLPHVDLWNSENISTWVCS